MASDHGGLGMESQYVAVFSDLERHSNAWVTLPKSTAVELVSEYRGLAEALVGRYGAAHQNFTGDGHLFLFEAADVAVQFGLNLVRSWQQRNDACEPSLRFNLRIGCHSGECTRLGEGDSWVGRAIGLAKRVEEVAPPNCVLVTEAVLEMLDLPLYTFAEAGRHPLKGDYVAKRTLYQVSGIDEAMLAAQRNEDLSAKDCFLRALAVAERAPSHREEMLKWYGEALKRRADYPEAHNNLAILLRQSGNESDAAFHYREALRLRADYPEAHYNYALLLAARGSQMGAIDHLQQAIRLRPHYVDAHHLMANLMKRRGDSAEASAHYRRIIELRPTSAEAHNNLAILLHEGGEHGDAKSHYLEALRLRAAYPEAHYNYALLLEDMGQLLAAQKHYQQAIELRPDYAEAHNNLAALLHTQGCVDEAAPHYKRALELRPADPEAHYNYALLLRAAGDEVGAAHHFAIARELAPDTQDFHSEIEPPR